MDLVSALLIPVVVLVAVFDFTNGFHAAADMAAAAIASRAMKPGIAVDIVTYLPSSFPLLWAWLSVFLRQFSRPSLVLLPASGATVKRACP